MARLRCQRANLHVAAAVTAAECKFLPLTTAAATTRNLRSSEPLAVGQHFTDRGREFRHARGRYDDRVATAMRFLCDAQEFSAIVLAQFHVKVFALDLYFAGLDDVIHLNRAAIVHTGLTKGKLIFTARHINAGLLALGLRVNSAPPSWLPVFLLAGDGEIHLAFEGIDPDNNHSQLIADGKTATRLAAE